MKDLFQSNIYKLRAFEYLQNKRDYFNSKSSLFVGENLDYFGHSPVDTTLIPIAAAVQALP